VTVQPAQRQIWECSSYRIHPFCYRIQDNPQEHKDGFDAAYQAPDNVQNLMQDWNSIILLHHLAPKAGEPIGFADRII